MLVQVHHTLQLSIQGMVHYFVLWIAPYPNTSCQYYGECVNKCKALVQAIIQKMVRMIPTKSKISSAFKILCTSLRQKLPHEITDCALYHNTACTFNAWNCYDCR